MRRRGMTLIEMLLALALLGAMCSLLTSWLVTVARLSTTRGAAMQWRSAAMRVLDAMGDDLTCGDFQPIDHRRPAPLRFEILEAQRLAIMTRPSGPGPIGAVTHEYRLDLGRNLLILTAATTDNPQTPTTTRMMLSQVANLQVRHNEEEEVITVTIRSLEGDEVSRRYQWP